MTSAWRYDSDAERIRQQVESAMSMSDRERSDVVHGPSAHGQAGVASEGARRPVPVLRGLQRGIAVVEALANEPMRLSELCRHLGIPWASVNRLISQLQAQQFVEREPDSGRYRVGQACWLIGSAYTAQHPILDVARANVELLSSNVDAVVQLCERADRFALTLLSVHRWDSESILKTTYGYHFPLHCGSKGQVLLAYSEPDFIDAYLARPLEQLTSETIIDPDVLLQVLYTIRKQGFARTEGDVQTFTGSLAAPVFGRDRKVVASVCLICRRSALVDCKEVDAMTEQLLGVARSISAGLGWRPGDDVWHPQAEHSLGAGRHERK
ncbi:MAG: IclR family transcriptional regulator [Acidimicrobiales bacterium]